MSSRRRQHCICIERIMTTTTTTRSILLSQPWFYSRWWLLLLFMIINVTLSLLSLLFNQALFHFILHFLFSVWTPRQRLSIVSLFIFAVALPVGDGEHHYEQRHC